MAAGGREAVSCWIRLGLVAVSWSLVLSLARGAAPEVWVVGEVAERWAREVLPAGAVEVRSWAGGDLPAAGTSPALVLAEGRSLTGDGPATLAAWVAEGGVVFVAGLPGGASWPPSLVRLLGVRPGEFEPAAGRVWPRLVATTPLLAPLEAGDAPRLGLDRIQAPWILEAAGAKVLARGMRLTPWRADAVTEEVETPTIALNRLGRGRVLFVMPPLWDIVACRPPGLAPGRRDCSGAATAEALLRWWIVDLLYELRAVQVPLRWETPAGARLTVLVTGDVHDDGEGVQIRSALQLAALARRWAVPLTLYVVGQVAESAPELVEGLRQNPLVVLQGHSLKGQLYDESFPGGAEAIGRDYRRARAALGLDGEPLGRSLRTESWSSAPGSWPALAAEGVTLLLDQVADLVRPRDKLTPMTSWFRAPPRARLSVPILSRAISTMAGDGRLPAAPLATIGSPQPDPCCNDAVTWDDYMTYVRSWHGLLRRLGARGGLFEVWLWHPATPAWKGGFDELGAFFGELRGDDEVLFLDADRLAGWWPERDRGRLYPQWERGRLVALDVVAPAAPPSRLALCYWVIGEARPPGWQVDVIRDSIDRVVTRLCPGEHGGG